MVKVVEVKIRYKPNMPVQTLSKPKTFCTGLGSENPAFVNAKIPRISIDPDIPRNRTRPTNCNKYRNILIP